MYSNCVARASAPGSASSYANADEVHFVEAEVGRRPNDLLALGLRVLDLNGRLVQEEALNIPSTHLNLPAGVYSIEVRQGAQVGREKVVLR